MSLRHRRLNYKMRITSPLQISGCTLWLDFSDASTLFTDDGVTNVASNDDLIYRANDKSGNGIDLKQATSNYRPLYKTSYKNGLSAAQFDLDVLSTVSIPYTTVFSTEQSTIVAAWYPYYQHAWLCSWWEPVQNNQVILTIYDNVIYSAHTPGIIGVADTDYSWRINAGVAASNGLNLYKNTTLIGSDPTQGSLSAANATFDIGATWGSAQRFYEGELIIYNKALSDKERIALDAYLNRKWAIY